MKIKLSVLICMMAVFGMKMSAQNDMHYGIFVGGSVNMMNIDKALYYDDSEVNTTRQIVGEDTTYIVKYLPIEGASVNPCGGFVLGGYFGYDVSKTVGLQFELLFNQHGYNIKGVVNQKNILDDNYVAYDYSATLKMSNVSAAVLLNIKPLEYFSVDLGVQPSYCFRMIKEGKRGIESISTNYSSDNDYNSLNISATGGLTGYYGNFFLAARYTLGFVDVLKVKKPYYPIEEGDNANIKYTYSDVKSTTSSVIITLGYKIK